MIVMTADWLEDDELAPREGDNEMGTEGDELDELGVSDDWGGGDAVELLLPPQPERTRRAPARARPQGIERFMMMCSFTW
ncbi:MAG: hypothetical protein ACR2K3_10010 [Nocardioides sp.]